ncbi:MAG: 16S rRNA (guanine(966)-N(2))-methyltransferase RsmD [Smithella sp.]|jgi:16S rRNA (guanine(966)-N(2))-methyltransferase RsmD
MRIISGTAKGKNLSFPSGSTERPTSDFLREALFNLLGSLEEKTFLDLFAGSGSVGLEAASRGAHEVYFVEKDKKLVHSIERNVHDCRLEEKCFIMTGNIEKGLRELLEKKCKIDIVFADPPYQCGWVGMTLNLLCGSQILNEKTVIVIQHSVRENFVNFLNEKFHLTDQRKYGDNALTFLKMENK